MKCYVFYFLYNTKYTVQKPESYIILEKYKRKKLALKRHNNLSPKT